MKNLNRLGLAMFAISLMACQQDQKESQPIVLGEASISNRLPQQGDVLTLTFTDADKIDNIVMHYSTGEKTYLQDVPFTLNEKAAIGKVQVPDSAVSLAFNFLNGFSAKNDPVTMGVVTQNNTPLPGALIGQATYYTGIGKQFFGHELEADSILSLYQKDLQDHPQLLNAHQITYAALLMKSDKARATEILKKEESRLLAQEEPTQSQHEDLYRLYQSMQDRTKADSVLQVLKTAFPNSEQAMFDKFSTIQRMNDLAEKDAATREFMQAHPDHRASQFLNSALAQAYAREGNYDKFMSLMDQITIARTKASAMNSVAWNMAEGGGDLEKAASLSKSSLEILEAEINDPQYDPAESTKKLTAKSLESFQNMFRDTYAFIQYKQGNLKEAIKYQEMATASGASAEQNERLVQFLLEDEQHEAVIAKASGFISHNKATAKMREYLEMAYSKSNSSGTFEDLIAGLELKARENLKAEVMNKMIDEEASGFTLKDIEGGEVNLAELKGKTVVLDFWATWCGPCKASFPGMQKALDKYAEDEDVVFLFIDTFERHPDEKRIELTGNFIEKNNYGFTVLLDTMEAESGTFTVADDYGVSGIPTKVVIGPDGRIKFQTVGWSGNIDQLVTEMDLMIELARS